MVPFAISAFAMVLGLWCLLTTDLEYDAPRWVWWLTGFNVAFLMVNTVNTILLGFKLFG